MKLNITEIAQTVLSSYPGILSIWLPGGYVRGHEFMCGSLQGERGESLSINTRTGAWADFATGERGGDPVSLYAAIHRLSQLDAAKELAEQFGVLGDAAPKPAAREQRHTQIIPAPDSPPVVKHRLGKPSASWCYRTAENQVIGYIHRFEKPDGKKEIIPQIYARGEDGQERWVWKSFGAPRPLYNLPSLNDGSKYVLLVEGEKTADAAASLFPKLAVVTWPGGSKAVGKADFSPLNGRRVLLWPDNDQPGFEAMHAIGNRLRAAGCTVRYVLPPEGSPEGWDIADAAWSPEEADSYLRANMREDLPEYRTHEEPPVHEEPPQFDEPSAPSKHVFDSGPFRCLGYDKTGFYYFAAGRQQVVFLTAAQHTKNHLLQIAPGHYWRSEYPKGKTGDFDVEAAADAMMRGCERKGVFSASRMRGRGAWYDSGNIVVHLGDRVIIDGMQYPPCAVQSDSIYEAAIPLRANIENPLHVAEANRFMKFLEMLPWERPIYAKLAAGWCVVAHIGGVMKWRPHVWVVGRKGSGKTYVMSRIIRPVLGDNCLFVQGASTEAGVRQRLGSDSLPVLFDEAEGEGQQQHQNLQRVLQLVRQSSSETGGQIAKGTPGGQALNFSIRSCFAFSSINANLVQESDRSRVSVLELNSQRATHQFEEITRTEVELLTEEYIERFYARSMSLASVIRDNAMTFAKAAAVALGEQRAGDQIGALLSGCYALHSNSRITLEDAVAWVNAQDWSEQKRDLHGQSGEANLFAFLMQQKLRVKTENQNGDESMPIGYLVDVATGQVSDAKMSIQGAKENLRRNGFLVDGNYVIVHNTHAEIAKLLANSNTPVNWGKVLQRIPGAEVPEDPIYFGYTGSTARAVKIPLDYTNV